MSAAASQLESRSESIAASTSRWNLFERIAFRFAFVYLIPYCWPSTGRVSLLDALPLHSELLSEWANAPMRALCPWVAVHVFRLTGPVTQYHPTGSGDTTLDYVQLFCFATAALIAAAIWSLLDRRRTNYCTLYAWLRAIVRLALSLTLFSYGFAKVMALQMPAPSLTTLTKTFGQASPMNLLWTFMGASSPYERFTGFAEMTAGLLLLFRRTSTLGACAAAGVMLNVVMLNFCYDVPVKLYSSHLLLMSLFLLLPDAGALWQLFILRNPVKLRDIRVPRLQRRGMQLAAVTLYASLAVSILHAATWGAYQQEKDFIAQLDAKPPLYGVWAVDGVTDPLHWRTLIVDRFSTTVRSENGDAIVFNVKVDVKNQHWKMSGRRSQHSGEINFSQPDPEHAALTGSLDGVALNAALHRVPASQFLLINRGFHWINEDPFNR